MIRAPMGSQSYWNEWERFRAKTIEDEERTFQTPSANPIYRPQYVLNNVQHRMRYLLTLYSWGAPVPSLVPHFEGLMGAWELSNSLSDQVCREHELQTCRDWDFSLANLNHYNWCFWLIGLALVLEIPDDQWQRLMALVGGEGEDALLDRVIASRDLKRKIGSLLLHQKPYARLIKAIDAPKELQAILLLEFVNHWYVELKRPAPKNSKAPTIEPFWYIYGDPEKHPLERGSYFGRWCIEAAAAAKAFGLDDSLCLGNEYYPGDLLRPNEASTHPLRDEPKQGLLAKLFGKKKV